MTRKVKLWLGVTLGVVVAILTTIGLMCSGPDTTSAGPGEQHPQPTRMTATSPVKPATSRTPAPPAMEPQLPASSTAVKSAAGDNPKPPTPDMERASGPSSDGGVEIVAFSGGEPLGCAIEVFTSSEPKWPWPLDRAGVDAPPSSFGDILMGSQVAAMPQLNRYVGSNGHCLVPRENRVSVSLVVIAEGCDMQSFDRVELSLPGEPPRRLNVEFNVGQSSIVVGRVVDETGHGVESANVVWSARHPGAPWRAKHPAGSIPRMGGDQFRAALEVADETVSDGAFQLTPVLPSENGVVRVFIGDVVVAYRKNIHTLHGKTTSLDPITVPSCRVVTVRLMLGGRRVGAFRIVVTGGVTAPGINSVFEGASYAHSNRNGEIKIPVRMNDPVTIRLMSNDQEGRFSYLNRSNSAFYLLLMGSQQLVNQVLASQMLQVQSGAQLENDVTISLGQDELTAALEKPEVTAALAAISESFAESAAAPKDLLNAAHLATEKKDLLPLLRLFLEPLN